jgi:hypothetical protein
VSGKKITTFAAAKAAAIAPKCRRRLGRFAPGSWSVIALKSA